MLTRRGVLRGLLAAPAIIRTPGLLMAVRPVERGVLIVPLRDLLLLPGLRKITANYRVADYLTDGSAWFLVNNPPGRSMFKLVHSDWPTWAK